ncbi:P-loop containing nucleoside triphosphate hydrolase protein [Schizothecium vesticola]|uniref:P-loop containing nucleoside triphosphate hydrolase protein n=1 Tax=Schizothecium vesticola TaxID=314040 RepID=A0AA40EX68_9PEZI|nr:P-loop containing nucleoside triphosphate hydrolase protein [Schizothecium vesticola]
MAHNPHRHPGVKLGAMLPPGTAKETETLAAINRLRELDRRYVLPQIIVCGSQSVGKSSVLESIIQVPFPRGDGTCTRYVTKVTMQYRETPGVEVRIQPGEDRDPVVASFLGGFKKWDNSAHYATKLGEFMDQAHRAIFRDTDFKSFTNDIMLVTVSGPEHRPLEVLDLPGLIAFDQNGQGDEHFIKAMVTRYMEAKQSIILVVINANQDLNTHPVLALSREFDPDGERTLGIITRPDVAEKSQKENLIADIWGPNQHKFKFGHRWHILRNRSAEEAGTTQEMRDQVEKALLDSPPWNKVDARCLGVAQLRERLRELLFNLAKRELPGLRDTFHGKIKLLQDEFDGLGGDEFKPGELQIAVALSLSRLHDAARDHARGIWESDIRHSEYGSNVNLRSRVVERSEVFRDRLVEDGHAWNTRIRLAPTDPDSDLGSIYREKKDIGASALQSPQASPRETEPKKTHPTLEAEIDEVVNMLEQTRDDNLPTFFSPQRIKHLFWRMSNGWNAIALAHVQSLYNCCEQYFHQMTPIAFQRERNDCPSSGFRNPSRVANRFVVTHVISKLQECHRQALEELLRLEQDRLAAPMNLDLRFLKDRRAHRQGRDFRHTMRASHHLSGSTPGTRLDQTSLAEKSGLHSQRDLTKDTAETYLDAMWSHYLIERDIYIINVVRQVGERHFLRHIAKILPKDLEESEREMLVRNNTAEEARKMEIKKEMAVLEESLAVLAGI